MVNIGPEEVSVGLCVAGSGAHEVLEQFRKNLTEAPDLFFQRLKELPEDVRVRGAEGPDKPQKDLSVERLEDVQALQNYGLIDIKRIYPHNARVLRSPAFAQEVANLFKALYPLFHFATSEVLEPEDFEEPGEKEKRYTREALRADTFLDDSFWAQVEALLEDKKQIIFYGPPGTGKTWLARQFARYWVESAGDPAGQVAVVQFHPSYAYEEFVEGIRPRSEEVNGVQQVVYPVRKGVFYRFCEKARGRPDQRHVLILDEINRGDIPRILGELLYLLEYRGESVTLPYSGEFFAIPESVYIIGTMNTADRSIALVDHALRRRFHFVPLHPNPDVLRAFLKQHVPQMAWVADLLERLNQRLEAQGIEWHLHIGHSHFMRKDLDEEKLRLIWEHSVLPTLEEYFFQRLEKLEEFKLERLRGDLGI
jgi:hypothetical protein